MKEFLIEKLSSIIYLHGITSNCFLIEMSKIDENLIDPWTYIVHEEPSVNESRKIPIRV